VRVGEQADEAVTERVGVVARGDARNPGHREYAQTRRCGLLFTLRLIGGADVFACGAVAGEIDHHAVG
jgi:hypothetical protein